MDSPAGRPFGGSGRRTTTTTGTDSPARNGTGTVAQRQLGSIGGRTGPGYSPYARRVASRQAQFDYPRRSTSPDSVELAPTEQEPRQSTGLFGKVRSLPGRMFGYLSRSSSKQQGLSTSSSLADVRAELDQVRGNDAEPVTLQRSKTSNNLMRQAVTRGGANGATAPPPMPSSSSMSALSSLGGTGGGRSLRSAHSKLNLAPSTVNGSRGVSPAAAGSVSSYSRQNRSPSPLRNGLAGSMSTFQLARYGQEPPSPPTLGDGVSSNPFGLQSQSPFAASRTYGGGGSSRSTRSNAAASIASQGHPLFPYSSNLPRGMSPALSGSFSMRDGLSAAGSATKRTFTTRAASPLARSGHVLPSGLGSSKTVSGGLSSLAGPGEYEGDDVEMLSEDLTGAERARKKQLVWDPERGLVSREKLEEEKARAAPTLPKNEAERILEVLEGMGRTPMGEAKRGSIRPKHISIPSLADENRQASRLSRSSTTPSFLFSSTPYAARSARPTASPTYAAAKPEKGLQAVLRAREERRRALLEQERAERERERLEDEERERERERKRRDRRRRMEELMSDDDAMSTGDVFSDEPVSPRRVTRSSARQQQQTPAKSRATKASSSKGKAKEHLEPPAPETTARRSTRASSRPKSPSPAPPARKTRKQAEPEHETEQDDEQTTGSKRTVAAKSPSPSKSPSPALPAAEPKEPTPPKISFPAPSSFPATAPSTSTGRSSLRPGKSHTSRQHTTSSRVFSAKEEDLPPIDDAALAKIQMPAFKVPSGFSFGVPPATAAPTAKADEPKKDAPAPAATSITPAAPTPSLLSRLGAPPPPSAEPAKPAFSFGATGTETNAPAPKPPTFSFGAAPTEAAAKDAAPPKAPAASDFFAKPAVAAAAAAPSFSFGATDSAAKPNFFGSIIADKDKATDKAKEAPAKAPSFSFGATSDKETIKPTEIIPPTPSSTTTEKPAAANPFAAFGKPVAEIVKEAAEGKKEDAPKPSFSFGADAAKKDDEPAPKAASPFAFGSVPAKSDSAPAPFAFGAASKPSSDTKAASPFSFGAPAAPAAPAAKSAAPTFTFGTTPATPTADEKKDATPAPLFGGAGGGLSAPSAPASVTDEAGDSGMEDEADPEPATAPAAPAFSFGATSAAPAASASPFGSSASTGFTFGSPEKKNDPPASPFGAPASNSFFGGNASPSKPPAFTFGASASPSPAPPSPAPASGAATPSFNFGSAPAATSSAPSFSFGAAAPAASAAPSFTFGAATPSTAPASPAPSAGGFTFGAAAPASAAMGQTLSTASTAGSTSGQAPSFTFGASTPAAGSSTPTNGGFTFGASAPATGAFGSSAPATSAIGGPAGASPFSFGAPASQPGTPGASAAPGGGFAFGAPTANGATTPGATTPGGGLFNIGTGGGDDSNKGRPIRPLRRTKR